MELLLVFLLALTLDVSLGEPPRAIHPVVWMGKAVALWQRFAPTRGRRSQLVYGASAAVVTIGVFTAAAYYVLAYASQLNPVVHVILGALLLKSTVSLRELRRTAFHIRTLLTQDRLAETRIDMQALVSRDTRSLETPGLVSATLESVAESLCDSIVAPLFYFLLFGVPGAVAYRAANTLDSMIGYHGECEYLGKTAARIDDALNFVPARLSGLLLVLAARLCKKDSRNAWRVMLRDHAKTESPNAGWPISAMAGALQTRLEKAGHYRLGSAGTLPGPELILSGVRLNDMATVLWIALSLIAGVTYYVLVASA